MVTTRLMRMLAVLLVVVLGAAACGGPQDEETSEAGEGDPSDAPTTADDGADGDDQPSAAEATGGTGGEVAGEGATLRVNWGGFPENWLPGADFADGYLDVPYESLFNYDEDGEIIGYLVTDWEQDDEGLTLTLRDDVVFHDGTPMDAEAVRASIEATRDAAGRGGGALSVIESIDVVDDLTVRLNTAGAAPGLTRALATLSGFVYSQAAIEDGTLTESPVGTGPWAHDHEASSTTSMVFTFFEDYWDGRESVGFDTVELFAIEDDTAATGALESGEIDLTDTEVPFLEQFDASDTVDYLEYPAVRNSLIFFDRAPDASFGDPDVRRAACYALDTSVVSALEPDIVPTDQFFAEGQVGYNPDIEPYTHDPDRAQELYEQAGSPEITGDYLSTFFNNTQITVYAEQMAELGIDLTVQGPVPPPEFFSAWNTGQYPVGTGSQDEVHPYDWYLSWFAADGPNNPSGHESDALAAAAEEAIAAGTGDEADALWAEVVRVIHDEALTCGRMIGNELLAWRTDRLTDVSPTTDVWTTQTVDYKRLRPVE